MINQKRLSALNKKSAQPGPIVYWMSRDQRAHNNWALLYALELAKKQNQSVGIVFCLIPKFLGATIRQYDFMLKGLQQVQQELKKYNLPFFILSGKPELKIPHFVKKNKVGTVVTDFSPLKNLRFLKRKVARSLEIPLIEIDAHNIVPCRIASPKQEYAARTFRPKIKKLLKTFLTSFPRLTKQKYRWPHAVKKINWKSLYKKISVDQNVVSVDWITVGEKAAKKQLSLFIKNRLNGYAKNRNDPTLCGQSGLSPYLHFGHIAAQQIAYDILKTKNGTKKDRDAFLEELIVRKELSDNYCYYNKKYDSPKGFPAWALTTLHKHMHDKRAYIYSKKIFEKAKTHDELWNAAQLEMVLTGKMHGYMRMYWAKKILEWSKNYQTGFKIAAYLNDKYELDGRDPNGYVGVAWSIGGVHDRPWAERAIFGTIRYMSYEGCKRKFDVGSYIKKIKRLHDQHTS